MKVILHTQKTLQTRFSCCYRRRCYRDVKKPELGDISGSTRRQEADGRKQSPFFLPPQPSGLSLCSLLADLNRDPAGKAKKGVCTVSSPATQRLVEKEQREGFGGKRK